MKSSFDQADLTDAQILLQCKMYVAAVRLADDFGCATIGIQYQQGLKDLLPASDLVEGTLNNTDRPPVKSRDGRRVLYDGQPLPHFNEVDECAGLDALVTNRLWKKLGFDPETTLHDVRYGEEWVSLYARFSKILRDLGWVERQNIAIEWRFADGKAERLADLAVELGWERAPFKRHVTWRGHRVRLGAGTLLFAVRAARM